MGAGHRVLVVEDETMVAKLLYLVLQRGGYAVIGPASSVRAALASLSEEPPDVALLDVRLDDGPAYPVADALRARGVPFAFLTGDGSLPGRYHDHPCISKPFHPAELLAAVAALLRL